MKNISHLERNIKDSIINDLRDVALFHSRKRKTKKAGYFSTPRQVFCYIDYLGGVAFGGRHTKRAVRFLKEYFPENYREFAELLYSMWRHGTVHGYEPESFYLECKNENPDSIHVAWLVNNSTNAKNRKENMKVYAMQGHRNHLRLVVNTCQLVDDLLSSVDKLTKKMRREPKFKMKCEQQLNKMGSHQRYIKIEDKDCRAAVEKQIRLAHTECSGYVDRKWNVIERFEEKRT